MAEKKDFIRFLTLFTITLGVPFSMHISTQYLEANFNEGGEAYYKGYGHLIEESVPKSMLFFFLHDFCFYLFLFGALFAAPKTALRKKIFPYGLLALIVVLLGYTLYLVPKIRQPRTIEILVYHTMITAGYIGGYILGLAVTPLKKNTTPV